MTSLHLRLERKGQEAEGNLGGGVMMTPGLGEDYWSYRVCLSEGQAVLGFPKFGLVGIGFAVEDADWNTNLPAATSAEEICDHIWLNRGDDSIKREDVIAAIELIKAGCREDGQFMGREQ